jgi:uncharacterized protein YbcV (DUF1398 family)
VESIIDSVQTPGVVRYELDFAPRTVAYLDCNGEEYIEAYPVVEID